MIVAGYDGGVTGGIIVMEPFAREFFPSTVDVPDTNFYCKYDDRVLQTFASIMHFTGALAAFPAGHFTAKYGRTRYATSQRRIVDNECACNILHATRWHCDD